MSKASPVTAYCNIEVDPKAGRCIAVAQHAEACGNISIKHAAYAQGAALGDRLCMYNLAASLCNPGPCQDLQAGVACYLFFLHQSKHCPCTSIGMVLAAVENLAMMLRQLDQEGGIPQITQLPFDAFEIMRSVAKGAKERGKKEGKKCTSASCCQSNTCSGQLHKWSLFLAQFLSQSYGRSLFLLGLCAGASSLSCSLLWESTGCWARAPQSSG